MEVLLHARHDEEEPSAALGQRQQVLAKVIRVAPEVLVGVDAENCVEELPCVRQIVRFRMDGHDLFGSQPERAEPLPVFRGFDPKVGGIYPHAVLQRKQQRGNAFAAPEVEHERAFVYRVFIQHLLEQLGGVRPHDGFA
ncbi:hypothetical protein SDC9_111809 [bioreactor metagenome]|uniref:Uncharacterized protein n=1 Tax=bioreactor metagenome TaxID=1076179 RepID=A0A645BIK8_9ZZZZ